VPTFLVGRLDGSPIASVRVRQEDEFMHDERSHDNSGNSGDGNGPERAFRLLRQRPTDELDSDALWRRIEGDLEPRPAGWFARLVAAMGVGDGPFGGWAPSVPQFAAAAVIAVLAVGTVWLAPTLMTSTGAAAGAGQLVPLAGGVGEGDAASTLAQGWALDVRLVRGYTGAAPSDALVSAADGAGGADRLSDLRGALAGLLPFEEIALVGAWRGAIEPGSGATLARLSDAFELRFDARSATGGLSLSDVLLAGAGRPLVADALALTPGRPYLFGVQAEGEDTETGSLVLAVRLLPVSAPTPQRP
jgi:hypothetical protein